VVGLEGIEQAIALRKVRSLTLFFAAWHANIIDVIEALLDHLGVIRSESDIVSDVVAHLFHLHGFQFCAFFKLAELTHLFLSLLLLSTLHLLNQVHREGSSA